jgi:hypothetical protein
MMEGMIDILEVSSGKKDVFRLNITVDDLLFVQVLNT